MGADRDAGGGHLLGDFRMPHRVLADLEERRLEAIVGQRLEHGGRVVRPRAVVEGQNDFLVAQEIILLEMLEAEAGTAGRVDLDDARKPHAAGLVTRGDTLGSGRCCRRRPSGVLGKAHRRGGRWPG